MFPIFSTISSPLSEQTMAVEAFSPQLYRSRKISWNAVEDPACVYGGGQAGFAGGGSLAPAYNAVVPTTTTNESGGGGMVVNNNNNSGCTVSKKRPRESLSSLSFLGGDVSSLIYDHMLDVDRLIVQHVMNARTELSQKRKRFTSQIAAALNESVSKQLKSKDEEIEQLRKLSWAMEERIKSLGIENNAWRYLASTHEAAAATLRANLDQVAAEQAAVAEDAESCCGDNFCRREQPARDWKRMCRSCGNGEPSVLLLPCRHLCLCSACAPAVDACPICKCRKDGSVNVNLS